MNTVFKQTLKAKAHHLKPTVLLGAKGLTDAVINEANVALLAHELIKIKISGVEKAERMDITMQLCTALNADFIQLMGHTATLYRKNKESQNP